MEKIEEGLSYLFREKKYCTSNTIPNFKKDQKKKEKKVLNTMHRIYLPPKILKEQMGIGKIILKDGQLRKEKNYGAGVGVGVG